MKTFIAFSLLALSPLAYADGKVLRWGADSEGGAPYVMRDPKSPSHTIGFEVDLASMLATEMGMEKAEFVQNSWDSLVPGLKRGDYDVAMNGIEITEDRKAEVNFSVPYFATYEQLTVRKNTFDVNSLSDLKGKKVATLKASLAERMLQTEGGIDVRGYDSQTTMYEDVANGRVEAVLLDHPVAVYYGDPDRRLKPVGVHIGQLFYGIAVRKDNTQLLTDINNALNKLIKNGKLRELYDRYSIWNPMMGDLFNDHAPSHTSPTEYQSYLKAMGLERGWKDQALQYASYIPLLARGAITTLELSLLGMIFAVTLGLFVALMRLYSPPPFSQLAVAYVEFVRGTPLLIQLFFIFYGLPNIGIKLSPFTAAVLGLALNYAACEAEVYRAGILSIPRSQMDTAFALGMTRWQALRHIIIPQAMRVVIPPVTNDFIAMLKDSSLVSVITMVELTKVYGQLASTYYDYFGIGLLAALMYFVIGLPFVQFSRFAETHFAIDRPQGGVRIPGSRVWVGARYAFGKVIARTAFRERGPSSPPSG